MTTKDELHLIYKAEYMIKKMGDSIINDKDIDHIIDAAMKINLDLLERLCEKHNQYDVYDEFIRLFY